MKKELHLLNLIAEDATKSQRELARCLDVSLGTVNNMIQSLEDEDFLNVDKRSSRKVFYTLTDKGYSLHNSLFVGHVSECFDTIAAVRKTFKENLKDMVQKGKRRFYVQGETDELLRLAKMCFFELARHHDITYKMISEVEDFERDIVSLSDAELEELAVVGWSMDSSYNYQKLTYRNLLS